jgi:serine/threonine protein kinase
MTGIVNNIARWLGRGSLPQAREHASYCQDRLVLTGQDGQQWEFQVPAHGILRIGRNPGNDVVLDDLLVSRWHATLWHEGGQYHLRDEGSVNGTCVNGRLVRDPVVLNRGDRIEIGTGLLFLLGSEQPVPALSREVDYPLQEEAPGDEPGMVADLDEYTVLAELGRGGMSHVYLARCSPHSQPVAIKVPNAALLADKEMLDKFYQEAEIGQTLHHQNIVEIYELRLACTPPYMVMEYVEGGRSLANRLEEAETLPLDEALFLAAQVADALGYAHGNGIIHRDIKPGNILLAPGNVAKVSDFGIAKVLTRSTITGRGTIWGTYRYMSTEQARGEKLDARSDLYSLGVVMYEMLTGRPPFVSDSPWQVVHAHIYEEPLPPRRLNELIPLDVEQVVLRALEKDPGRRYQSAEEMLADLRCGGWGTPDSDPGVVGAPRLAIASGSRKGVEVRLAETEVVLARANVDPDDRAISRSRHARISYYQGRYWLEDLGSTNGTFCYDPSRSTYQAIGAPIPLEDGDRFLIGNTELCYRE